MHKHEIGPRDGLVIDKLEGETVLGDKVPFLQVFVSEQHSVGISDYGVERSSVLVCPLRLKDGTLRPRTDPEPEFYQNAHFLIRIVGPTMVGDKYHQFDKDGKYLG